MGNETKQESKPGNPPNYKGDGVAVWINLDKNEQKYLSIQLLGSKGIKINAFKFELKPKEEQVKDL